MKNTITCYCGVCALDLADDIATCHFQCGCNSFLEITQIQKEGKKKMNSQDFLRGYKINIGDKFRRDKM